MNDKKQKILDVIDEVQDVCKKIQNKYLPVNKDCAECVEQGIACLPCALEHRKTLFPEQYKVH